MKCITMAGVSVHECMSHIKNEGGPLASTIDNPEGVRLVESVLPEENIFRHKYILEEGDSQHIKIPDLLLKCSNHVKLIKHVKAMA